MGGKQSSEGKGKPGRDPHKSQVCRTSVVRRKSKMTLIICRMTKNTIEIFRTFYYDCVTRHVT